MSTFTKKAIIESFIKILEKKNFDKITIKDIIEESGVSRSTFYYHFVDIYELAEETFEYECQKVLPENITDEPWQEILLNATQLAKESRRQLYHAFNNIDRQRLEKALYKMIERIMKEYILELSKNLNISYEDVEFVTTCYVSALSGIIMKCIGEGMKDDAAIFIKKVSYIFNGSILQALEKCEDSNKN